MSSSTLITLPGSAHIYEVAYAIGILMNKPHPRYKTHVNPYVLPEGTKVEASGQPDCPAIVVDRDNDEFRILYQYEWGRHGNRGFVMPMTPFNMALATQLVIIFGGSVDYDDQDSIDSNYKRAIELSWDKNNQEAYYNRLNKLGSLLPMNAEYIQDFED